MSWGCNAELASVVELGWYTQPRSYETTQCISMYNMPWTSQWSMKGVEGRYQWAQPGLRFYLLAVPAPLGEWPGSFSWGTIGGAPSHPCWSISCFIPVPRFSIFVFSWDSLFSPEGRSWLFIYTSLCQWPV